MTYEEVINTIENKRRFGKACGREVTQEFLKVLSNPERGMKVIHIAGTNGKGSVAAFTSSILKAASFASEKPFKVGTFTSPHLKDFTERIMVDGQQIPREDARRIGQMLLETKLSVEATMFDYCLAMALVYFKEQQVEYLVLETGLGGAKDSTAGLVTVPLVSAITSIGLEHTAILGDTLEKIAAEKAGIIKAGTKTVIGQMDASAAAVITEKCQSLGVPYVFSKPVAKAVELGLFGAYQRKNAGVAVEIARYLGIGEETISEGLRKAFWPGRMQIVSREPFILIDGAHNPQGVRALSDSLRDEFSDEKFTFIMAVMADKDYLEMAEIIKEQAKRIFTCTVDYSRALQAKDLAASLKTLGLDASAEESFEAALNRAKAYNEKVVVFGSLYFIGEVLKGL